MNHQRKVIKAVEIAIIIMIVFAGFGSAVLHLWNWLMPSLFGLRLITYWEAVGVMGLSWILFGGLRGFSTPPRRHGLSPEERERLRRAMETRTLP
jgi:hypothetical protein